MQLFRYATSVYGQTVLVGAKWDLFWWFFGAGVVFIVAHAAVKALIGSRADLGLSVTRGGDRVVRHRLPDRLYHWTMAAAVLTWLFTAFLPILGWKFEWVTAHWIAGIVLTAAVLCILSAPRSGRISGPWCPAPRCAKRMALRRQAFGRSGPAAASPVKYSLLQKLFHSLVAAVVLALVVTGLLMLLKIDTPFWRRNPYWFSDPRGA